MEDKASTEKDLSSWAAPPLQAQTQELQDRQRMKAELQQQETMAKFMSDELKNALFRKESEADKMDISTDESIPSTTTSSTESISPSTTTTTTPTATSTINTLETAIQKQLIEKILSPYTVEDKGVVYECPPVSFPATPYPIPNPRAFLLANFGIVLQQPTTPITATTTTTTPSSNTTTNTNTTKT